MLTAAITQTLEDVARVPDGSRAGRAPAVIGTLRRDQGGAGRFLASLAEAHVCGVAVDWTAIMRGGRRVELPTYAFQHERYWPQPMPRSPGDMAAVGLSAVEHPLLGAAMELAREEGLLVLTGRLSVAAQPWLADHTVAGAVVLPGTALLDMALRAGNAAGGGSLSEFTVEAPLILPADGVMQVQVTVGRADRGGHREVEVHARPEDATAPRQWARYAAGVLTAAGAPEPEDAEPIMWPPTGAAGSDAEELYRGPEEAGLVFGPAFRGLRAVWRRDDEVFAEAVLPDGIPTAGFGVHPALLDAVLRSAVLLAADSGAPGNVTMQVGWQGVRVHAEGATVLRRSAAAGGGRRAESGRGGWRWARCSRRGRWCCETGQRSS